MNSEQNHSYITRENLSRKCAAWFDTIDGLRGRRVPFGFKRPGLAVIDVQGIFVSETSPSYIPAWNAVASNVLGLIREFDRRKLPVVLTRHVHKTGDDGGVLGHFFGGKLILAEDRLSEIPPEVQACASSPVIWKKDRHDCFSAGLPGVFSEVDSLVVAGVQLPLCVAATATGLARHGVVPVVAADACAARDEGSHLATLRVLACGHSHVMSVSEIVRKLSEGG